MNPEIHESKYQMTSFKKMPGKRANPGEKQPLEFTFDPPVNGIKRAKGTGSTDTGNSRFTFNVSLYPEGSDNMPRGSNHNSWQRYKQSPIMMVGFCPCQDEIVILRCATHKLFRS